MDDEEKIEGEDEFKMGDDELEDIPEGMESFDSGEEDPDDKYH